MHGITNPHNTIEIQCDGQGTASHSWGSSETAPPMPPEEVRPPSRTRCPALQMPILSVTLPPPVTLVDIANFCVWLSEISCGRHRATYVGTGRALSKRQELQYNSWRTGHALSLQENGEIHSHPHRFMDNHERFSGQYVEKLTRITCSRKIARIKLFHGKEGK